MPRDKRTNKFYGDEAPTIRDFLSVLIILGVLAVLSWLAYFKLHMFH